MKEAVSVGVAPRSGSESKQVPSDSRPRTLRRWRHNTWIGLTALAAGLAAWTAFDPARLREGISIATAYAGLILLAASLAIGPLNLLRQRANPVSSDLRRDIGIWAAICGLIHVVAGLSVHMGGNAARYFIPAPTARSSIPLRLDAFGFANHLGLIAALLLLLLLIVSNNRALRRLGATKWKRLQRLNYPTAIAVVVHGVLYQLLERRASLLVIGSSVTIVVAILMQAMGRRTYLRKRAAG